MFVVRDRRGRPLSADGAIAERLTDDLDRLIRGVISAPALIEERRPRGTLPPRVKPQVAIEVKIDNQVSADFTVVDVYTGDRPGVLYTITDTLSTLGLDIHLSKVATEADRVADVFHLRAPPGDGGGKLADAAALQLRAALLGALAALPAW